MVCSGIFARSRSVRLLKAQLPALETTDGLLAGAIAIASHSFEDVELPQIDGYLHALAQRVLEGARSDSAEAKLARLHQVLFEEEGFRGNEEHYFHPLNSFLPAVVASRRGLPITLSLVYKVVGDRAGLSVEGVNSPAHFLVRVRDERGAMLIDAFHGGKVLNRSEAFALFDRAAGGPIPRTDHALRPATHRQWLSRMVGNLQHIYAAAGCWSDLSAMNDLQAVLGGAVLV